ncbi:MAG: nucleotidyl transferase AbiEii/AbiGii toxin family protein [Alkalispirochaeta sp.]
MVLHKYDKLYALQDDVMRAVFSRQLGFYLTGGTALSRFHLNHRYSDDLGFFTHEINSFGDAVRMVRSDLEELFSPVIVEVDAREFKRLRVQRADVTLKIDFVADRAPRVGVPENRDGRYVDRVRNILSNKVGAVISRDEARDVADLVQISRSYRFSWLAVLQEALEKQQFDREELAYRLSTFPVPMLRDVPYRSSAPNIQKTETLIRTMAKDIESGRENSLAGAHAPEL